MRVKGWWTKKARKCMHHGYDQHRPENSITWIQIEGYGIFDPGDKVWVCVGCNQRWVL